MLERCRKLRLKPTDTVSAVTLGTDGNILAPGNVELSLSDSYITSLDGLTTGACQVLLGVKLSS